MLKKSKAGVLFLDSVHPELENLLTAYGFDCFYFPDTTRENLVQRVKDFDGLIVRSKMALDKEILAQSTHLKFIGRVGSGMENVDVEFAESLGIRCLNSPEGNRDAVGEHACGMLLALLNNLIKADMQVKKGLWQREENRGYEIKGKTVGIIGYGNMGSAFAQRMKGFEANVIAYDKYKSGFSSNIVKEVSMDGIFNNADILSLHVPLTNETKYLVNIDYLSNFKKPLWIINTSRGKVVKIADIVSALKNNIIRGAAMDVLEYENSSFSDLDKELLKEDFDFLVKDSRVVLSPHIAGWTHESNIKLARVLADKINDLY
ncbi:MAG: NAD(P)-dependent oxidoreductase [Bacteroidota bacterium]